MAKAITSSTMSPNAFATGARIFAEDAAEVMAALNFSACNSPCVHFSLVTAPVGSTTGTPATHNITFPTASGLNLVYEAMIWIDPDVQELEAGSECYVGGTATDTVDVQYTVGSQTKTISHDETDNGVEVVSAAFDVPTIGGTGWQLMTVHINHTGGSRSDNALLTVRLEDLPITAAANIPDPV